MSDEWNDPDDLDISLSGEETESVEFEGYGMESDLYWIYEGLGS